MCTSGAGWPHTIALPIVSNTDRSPHVDSIDTDLRLARSTALTGCFDVARSPWLSSLRKRRHVGTAHCLLNIDCAASVDGAA